MRKRMWMAATAVLVALTACGGGDSTGDTDVTTSTNSSENDVTATTETTVSETTQDTSDGDTPIVEGVTSATVTIEGTTYRYGDTGFAALRCMPDMFGVFFAVLARVDEDGNEVPSAGGLSLILLNEGVDPVAVDQKPTLEVSINELDESWVANEDHITDRGLDPGTSQIDSYAIDGATASGTATVYEEESYYKTTGGSTDPIRVTQATFEVTCAEG